LQELNMMIEDWNEDYSAESSTKCNTDLLN